jgi:hypothetical protein
LVEITEILKLLKILQKSFKNYNCLEKSIFYRERPMPHFPEAFYNFALIKKLGVYNFEKGYGTKKNENH